MIVGVSKESYPGERRVALVPGTLGSLSKTGYEVVMESGAGALAGYPDDSYRERGARTVATRAEVFEAADVVIQVRAYGANREAGRSDLSLLRQGQVLIGLFEPLTSVDEAKEIASRGVTLFALELIPRISLAQSMDVLSSMATVAGYKAVLLATEHLPRMFPMLMTAAGTITPAKVLVVGAGVAGLQAIATARRLGGVVQAYDVRPAVKEQIESLGAKFVELPVEADSAEDAGGYAREQDESFYDRQRELMARVVADSDVIVTTALIPGKPAPVLITGEMVSRMAPGSVIVDLAAERGGNCELTRPGETRSENGVTIVGAVNVPSTVPHHASQLFAKNVTTFLSHISKEGKIAFDLEDEITRGTLVTRDGEIVHPDVRGVKKEPC